MSVVAFIEKCIARGMSLEAAMDAARAYEETLQPTMTARQARNARYYAAHGKRLKASESVLNSDASEPSEKRLTASETVLIKTPLARVENNLLRIIPIAKTVVDDARAQDSNDWPSGDARAHAAELVQLAATSKLDPSRKPGLVTSMGRVAQWRRDGASWLFDVVPTVQSLVAKSKTPIGSWTYFDGAIATSIAANRQALTIPEAPGTRGQGPPNLVAQITAEKAEARRRVLEG